MDKLRWVNGADLFDLAIDEAPIEINVSQEGGRHSCGFTPTEHEVRGPAFVLRNRLRRVNGGRSRSEEGGGPDKLHQDSQNGSPDRNRRGPFWNRRDTVHRLWQNEKCPAMGHTISPVQSSSRHSRSDAFPKKSFGSAKTAGSSKQIMLCCVQI